MKKIMMVFVLSLIIGNGSQATAAKAAAMVDRAGDKAPTNFDEARDQWIGLRDQIRPLFGNLHHALWDARVDRATKEPGLVVCVLEDIRQVEVAKQSTNEGTVKEAELSAFEKEVTALSETDFLGAFNKALSQLSSIVLSKLKLAKVRANMHAK